MKTYIIGQDTTKSASSAVGRGIVGGILLGPIGALGGALSGKSKTKTTFLIVNEDGTRRTEEVENGSPLYNLYIKYLEV